MRPLKRPFTVETKRTGRYWVQPRPTTTASISHHSDDQPRPRFLGTTPPEDLMPEAGREEALAMAAQVFGEPVAAQSYSSDVTGSEGPLSAEPAPEPQTPRVLPDLLAIARERSETEEAEKRRITRRSRSKREGRNPSRSVCRPLFSSMSLISPTIQRLSALPSVRWGLHCEPQPIRSRRRNCRGLRSRPLRSTCPSPQPTCGAGMARLRNGFFLAASAGRSGGCRGRAGTSPPAKGTHLIPLVPGARSCSRMSSPLGVPHA
jgi:hypothetical protein